MNSRQIFCIFLNHQLCRQVPQNGNGKFERICKHLCWIEIYSVPDTANISRPSSSKARKSGQ